MTLAPQSFDAQFRVIFLENYDQISEQFLRKADSMLKANLDVLS